MENEWMQDPSLRNIDRSKLEFMQKMFFESKKLTKKELMPFFMALAAKSKANNITFTPQETEAVIAVLKKHSSPDELMKINQVMKLYQKKGGSVF